MWSAGTVGDSRPDQLVGPYWARIDNSSSISQEVSQATDSLGNTFTAFSRSFYVSGSWVVRIFLNKVDRYATNVWYKQITLQGGLPAFYSALAKISFSPDGNLIISLSTMTNTTTYAYVGVVVKVSSFSGDALWQRTVSSTQPMVVRDAIEDSEGSMYLWGRITKPTDSMRSFPILIKLSSSGSVVWSKSFSTSTNSSGGMRMKLSSDGYLYLVAEENYSGFILYKVSTSGSVAWEKTTPQNFTIGFAGGCDWDYQNNLYLLYSNVSGASVGVMKFDSSGTLLWQKRLASLAGTWTEKFPPFSGLDLDLQGNVYAAFMGGTNQTWSNISKLTSSGDLVWNRRLTYGSQTDTENQSGYITASVSVDLDNNLHLHTSGNLAINARLPIDGTKTGTYSIGAPIYNTMRYLDSPMTATTDTHTQVTRTTTYYYPAVSVDSNLYATSVSATPWTQSFLLQIP